VIPPTRWLEALISHLPAARTGSDPEAVHQVRVAVARLRVWLALGGRRVLQDDLRWLRRNIAGIRDLDVHLAQSPPPGLAERLRDARLTAQRELGQVLDQARIDGLLRALALLPPLSVDDARARLVRLVRRARKRRRQALARPAHLPSLHALRCAVRGLRFALEWLGPCPDELVETQDALGAVVDRMVALRQLRQLDGDHPIADEHQLRLQRELDDKSKRAWRLCGELGPVLAELGS